MVRMRYDLILRNGSEGLMGREDRRWEWERRRTGTKEGKREKGEEDERVKMCPKIL